MHKDGQELGGYKCHRANFNGLFSLRDGTGASPLRREIVEQRALCTKVDRSLVVINAVTVPTSTVSILYEMVQESSDVAHRRVTDF